MGKRGRPTKYKSEFDEQAHKLCLLGAIDPKLADFFNVNEDTIHEWKKRHPSFSEAIKRGKMRADAEIAESLFNRARGCVIKRETAIKLTRKETDLDTKSIIQDDRIEIVELREDVPPDTTAAIFWLKNRQPKEWRDKQEHDIKVEAFEVTLKL